MKAKFLDKKILYSCWANPPEGSLALHPVHDKGIHWHHCREQFAARFNESTPHFYLAHPLRKDKDIAQLLNSFESIVASNINTPFEHTVFAQTNRKTILWIKPSRFWVDCQIKRSLLTLVLRCGKNYEIRKNNFDDALFGNYKECQYLKETKPAVLRFMFGFTKYVGRINVSAYETVQKHGWREEFYRLDSPSIRKKLTLPDGEKKLNNIIGLETLWT